MSGNQQFNPYDESWKTPEMREAEASLEEALARADLAIEKASAVRAETRPLTDAEVRAFQEAVTHPNAPAEVRQLAEKVSSGQYSWREIAEGKAMSDPEVAAAFQEAGRHVDPTPVQEIVRMLEEGHSPEDIVAARRPQSSRRDDGYDDEDGGGSIMRSAW